MLQGWLAAGEVSTEQRVGQRGAVWEVAVWVVWVQRGTVQKVSLDLRGIETGMLQGWLAGGEVSKEQRAGL